MNKIYHRSLRQSLFRFVTATLIFSALVSFACADEEAPIKPQAVKSGRPVDFAKDIAPIFRANCVACHNKAKSEGQLILEDTASIMKGGSSGEVVVPGKPDESYLYNVAARIEESYMPPMPNEVQAKKLTSIEVGLLRQWIVEGAKASSEGSSAAIAWQTINSELNAIYAVDTDPFGRFVAAGRAGNVNVYDLVATNRTLSLVDLQPGTDPSPQQMAHRDYVHSIAFHPSGQLLATSGFRVVKLWERELAAAITPLSDKPGKFVVSSDGKITAIQGEDGTVSVKNVDMAARPRNLTGYLPKDWTLLAIGGADHLQVVLSGADSVVEVIDLNNGIQIAASDAIPSPVVQAVITDAGEKVVVLLEDGTLLPLTLNAKQKKLIPAEPLKSNKGAIRQIALAGTTVMCRVDGNAIELRASDSLKPGVTIQSGTPNSTAAISPNAERVVTVSLDGIAELWNTKDAKLVATLNANLSTARILIQQTADKTARDARVKVVKGQITEDQKRVAEQQESVKKANEEVKKLTDALAAAKKKADAETPKMAAARKASEEKPDDAELKKKLDAATKAEQKVKDSVVAAENSLKSATKSVKLSKQALGRAEENVARRKELLANVEAEAKISTDVAAAAESKAKKTISSSLATFVGDIFVATVDTDGTTRLWKAADGVAVDVLPAEFPEAAKPTELVAGENAVLMKHADGTTSSINPFPEWRLKNTLGTLSTDNPSVFVDRILSLAFSPDGKILACGGGEASRSGELTLWNVADGKLLKKLEDSHSDTVYGLDFSRDGKFLASAAADKFVKVFDVSTGKHVRSYEGHTHHVMDVSWKGDGTQLASAGADNAIKVWNAETGEQSRTITTYSKQVTSLEFIGMEDEFISCSGDKRVFRHRAANGKTVREFKGCPDYVYCSATTGDGTVVVAGCEDGILRIWNGKDGKEIASFKP